MNHHGQHTNQGLQLRRSKNEDSTDTTYCMRDGDPWAAKQHHWKSEAKGHQLNPG